LRQNPRRTPDSRVIEFFARRIGQKIRECYRFEPPKISVEKHIRPTYVCEELHEAPITACAPPVILSKSMASPSLLAHVTNSKFNLGLPLYRVSQDLKRYRMDLSPGTLGTWMSIVGGEKVVPVVNLIRDGLFAALFTHIDEMHFGCLTHCRTMFFKARKVSNLPSTRTLANAAIEDYIGPVYRIASQIKALRAEYQQRGEPLPLETVLKLRQEKSKPILEKFKAWIDQILPATAPNSRSSILRRAEKHGSSATTPAAHRRAPICSRW
jgi:transposase